MELDTKVSHVKGRYKQQHICNLVGNGIKHLQRFKNRVDDIEIRFYVVRG